MLSNPSFSIHLVKERKREMRKRKQRKLTSKQADLESRATYLESSAEANISYYKRHAFAEKKVIELKRGPRPVKMHIMVREPQVVAEASGTKV
jgi:hypothetical protein